MRRDTTQSPRPDLDFAIREVRGQRVILDTDLARIYQVQTKALNQAVKRNRKKFPQDMVFQLKAKEARQIAQPVQYARRLVATPNRSQFVTGSQKHRDPRYRPFAFTEHGALMAATVLNSPRAVAMSLYVIRAFVKMRENLAADTAILKRLAEIDKTLQVHDAALAEVFRKLRPLLVPPPQPLRPEIGFHVKEDEVPYRVNSAR
ncbi:MAG: DNA-binding protein [Verrucomicrobia bacterium]|nr:MAG: DNA-binding protein [Verrucomicrobiota bacterium]